MAIKTIVDVEVDPEGSFEKFKAMFEDYAKQLAELPKAWGAHNEAAEKSGDALAGALGSLESEISALRDQMTLLDNVNIKTEKTASNWEKIEKRTKDTAKSVFQITTSLLRWEALSAAVTGVLGAGGLWGLDKLAQGVGAGRRSSQGLGTGYGEQASFETNFQRLIDAHGFLGGVNESLTDVTKRFSLYGAGLSETDISAAGGDTGKVAVEALQSLKRLADLTPTENLAQLIQSRGIGNLVTVEDLRRLKATSPEEFAGIVAKYWKNAPQFDLAEKTQQAWQDLGVQLESAWLKIDNSFVKGLTGLAEPIAHLSDAFSDAVKSFLDNPNLPTWIAEFGAQIEKLAEWMKTDEFKKDVEWLGNEVSELAMAIGSAVKWISGTLGIGGGSSEPAHTDEEDRKTVNDWAKDHPGNTPIPHEIAEAARRVIKRSAMSGKMTPEEAGKNLDKISKREIQGAAAASPSAKQADTGGAPGGSVPGTGSNEQRLASYFLSQGWTKAQVAGLLSNFDPESGLRADAFNPAGGGHGAKGLAQWRGKRQEDFKNLFGHDILQGTLDEQARFVQWELTHTLKNAGNKLRGARSETEASEIITRFYEGPDPAHIDAISNARAAGARKIVKHLSDDGKDHARPAQGADQTATGRPGGTVKVTIRNAPGNHPAVSVTQATGQ
jgi:hypothetical protein